MHYNKTKKPKEQSCSFFIPQDLLLEVLFLSEFYQTSQNRVIEASLRIKGAEFENLHKVKSRCFKKAQKVCLKSKRPKKNQRAIKEAQNQQKCLFDFADNEFFRDGTTA